MKNLQDIAMKTLIKHIDTKHHYSNAVRQVRYILNKKEYDYRPSEVLEKIKKTKYPKRLY